MIDFIGLELIEFHDLPLKGIEVKSDPEPKLEIEISVYDEKTSDYQDQTLVFGALVHLIPKTIPFEDYSDAEIYSFNYHLEAEVFRGKMTCLQGFGKPDLELNFSCKKVAIKTNDTE